MEVSYVSLAYEGSISVSDVGYAWLRSTFTALSGMGYTAGHEVSVWRAYYDGMVNSLEPPSLAVECSCSTSISDWPTTIVMSEPALSSLEDTGAVTNSLVVSSEVVLSDYTSPVEAEWSGANFGWTYSEAIEMDSPCVIDLAWVCTYWTVDVGP